MTKSRREARDPVSFGTHLAGALLSLAGLFALIVRWMIGNREGALGASIVFALSLIALYTASAVYHYCPGGERLIRGLRKLDHAMIYVLIAGSYTPMLMAFMNPPGSYAVVGVMWAAALVGITAKLCWFGAPRWLSTALYLLMGWAVVFLRDAVLTRMPRSGLMLLIAGGVSYSVGALVYIFRWPNIVRRWIGFHELFHLFVLGGSACHFAAVWLYVV